MEMSAPAWANTNAASAEGGGGPIHPGKGEGLSPETMAAADASASRLQNLRFLNGTSFLLTGMIVVGVVLFEAREGGVYADDFLWMKYQTLLTPATYVDFVWFPIFALQGLFVYSSTFHPTLKASPLAGYNRAIESPKTSVAVQYPAVCAATLLTVYSHDHGHVELAFLGSIICVSLLANVLRIQGDILDRNEEDEAFHAGSDGTPALNVRARALEYASLRLPFELHAGYALALAAVYFNAFLVGFEALDTAVFVAAANVALAGLLVAGWAVLWRTERKFYGAGAALVWYLLGVAVELRAPSQPIYNEFADGAILATQAVAGVAALVLLTMLGVRVMKTVIKYNIFNVADALEGDASIVSDGGGTAEISTSYVQA